MTAVNSNQNSTLNHTHQSAALWTEATRRNTFNGMLTEVAPQTFAKDRRDGSVQTRAGAPIVRVTTLEKLDGDEVSVDLIHEPSGEPVMGDDLLAGKGVDMSFASFTLKINQGRYMLNSGGKMTQQRTSHDLIKLARAQLGPYYRKLSDQITHVHMAGARGSEVGDWHFSKDSPKFDKILVNPVTPPTYDRHAYGGDADSLDTLDSADKMTLDVVDNLRLITDEMTQKMIPCKFEKDQRSEESPFFVLFVTPRQWFDFWTSPSGKDYRELLSNVTSRSKDFDSALFKGDCAMWHNILIRKIDRSIVFNAGDVVDVCTNTAAATVTQVQPGVKAHRAILVGAQAVADAYGKTGKKGENGYHFSMNTEITDHKNRQEHSCAWINGKAKVRFEGTDGRINDFGVMAVDTAVSG